MKKISSFLFSQKLSIILISIFAIAIAYATFIEDKYDTATAKMMVYNARWMEVLLMLLVINLISVIFKLKLYRKQKISIFLFHMGFILMIIGAGVTRYISYEGTMHIREGESSNILYSSESFLIIQTEENNQENTHDYKMDRSKFTNKPFNYSIDTDKGPIKIAFKSYIQNAVEELIENTQDGVDMLKIRVATKMGNMTYFINEGESKTVENITFAFNTRGNGDVLNISKINDSLIFNAPFNVLKSVSGNNIEETIQAGTDERFIADKVYKANGTYFLLEKYFVKAKKHLISGKPESNTPNAIIADVAYKGMKHEVEIFGGDGYMANMSDYQVDDLSLKMGYGNKEIALPFSLYLEDFILERYPGSNNPSSYKSKVILVDESEGLRENHEIYMNNILDHNGYRFFQSSYDRDELGTILSVNNDMPGTIITYISYILLFFGFFSTFFIKKSRFSYLRKQIRKTRLDRKSMITTIALIIGLSTAGFSQSGQAPVNNDHAGKFGHLVVQTFDGRFEPVHTLAYDVLHKIYKKNSIKVDGKGKLNGMQFYMDLMTDSEFWKSKQIIYIKEASIQDLIGAKGNYASFNDFFNQNNEYKLSKFSEMAYMKTKAEQTKFDKEIMKVNERLNILLMTFRGSMLKIFPAQNSLNHEWVSIDDSTSYRQLTGSINIINEDLGLSVLSYNNIFQLYLQEVNIAKKTNNYTRADQILGYIDNIQRQSSSVDVLPSEAKIKTEIHYNKARIFVMLKYFYMILSVVMLLLAFADHLRAKKSKLLTYSLNFFIVLLAAAFIYHTYGLVLRWYLSGHAPWSNGYEALVFVAWGGLLAGFSFMRYSKITLAATALLAFFIMLTAGFSSYDPQLTNLQPVLKSYWLIIHVAVIVISYGFLGLGFILGMMNIVIYLFKNKGNSTKLDLTIKDLTNINEMVLIIGIVLATMGTFLGAVWANESWGRYWGWDAKETWALIILMVYAVVLHLRMIPKLNNKFLFNTASVIAFGSVIMTFFGVNYYFSKGLHSYASESKAVFPIWAIILIIGIIALIYIAYYKYKKYKGVNED